MTKDELITKQQLKLAELEEQKKHNQDILKTLDYRFTGIGQPLNDNLLKMNNKQLAWIFQMKELIDDIKI